MVIKLTIYSNGKAKPILINLDNVIAIEDYIIYAKERNFYVKETLKEIEEKIEQIVKEKE